MFRLVHVIVAVTLGTFAMAVPSARAHQLHPSLPPGAVRVNEFSAGERSDIAAAVNVQQQAAAAAEAARLAQEAAARPPVRPAAPPALPAPAPASFAPGSIQQIIHDAFAPYGQGAIDWGERVAKCESGYNPRAYNSAGPYYGLFQFLMSTFKNTPYGNQDIYDPGANASAAAWKYSQGGASAWGCR